ncbi:extracellular solute-binding protein [uncultured Roseibium sp.]|uniref:extracellular solute-binding protein n=1 Tax=uncultured Roseibium sp. TaxID=1936171 RepID=UPI00321761D0
MKLTRRTLIQAAAAAVPLATLPRFARAGEGPILHASWGGGVGDTWQKAFATPYQTETGTDVRIVEIPNPEAQFRAQAGAPQYHSGICTYVQANNLMRDGLVETFDLEELPEMQNIDKKYWLTTPDGKLAGVTPYFAYYGIGMNANEAKVEDFSSWKNLADPEWKGRIGLTRPIYLSTYDLTIMSKAMGGDEFHIDGGMELLKGTAKNMLSVASSLAQQNAMLERGEVAAMPFYSVRVWSLNEAGADYVRIVLPDEGALLLPYVIVAPKGVADRDMVAKWLNYIASAAPQERGVALSGYIPGNINAKATDEIVRKLGMPFDELRAKLYQPDWDFIARHQKERVDAIEKMMAEL